jgi:branched-chain amino acid transport system ATP-binding protein
MKAAGALLEVEGIEKMFGGLRALHEVSMSLDRGRIVGLVGPNGSGKTTLINVISGLYKPDAGRILIEGADVVGLSPHRLARRGVNRTFQSPKPFAGLTVEENLHVAWNNCGHERTRHAISDVLELLGLTDLAGRKASELPGVMQKRVDLARALVTGAKLLLVDELGAGLTAAELDDLARLLRRLAVEWGMGLIVVEHLMGFLQKVTEEVLVLSSGEVIFRGRLSEAVENETVLRVFLGS